MITQAAKASQEQREWTEAELQALPEDGCNHEGVGGVLVLSPKNNFQHGDICVRLTTALKVFVRPHKLGVVLDSSTGFGLQNRNCSAPGFSFIDKARLRAWKRPPAAFFEGAPDLAVEIMGPSSTPEEIGERLEDFFASGTRPAWVIHPDEHCVEICHSPLRRKVLGSRARLDGEAVLPGFQNPVADLFRGWDWD